MRFDNDKTLLTPPEAGFIEGICKFHPEGSVADTIKLKMKTSIIDYAVSLNPPLTSIQIQGTARYPVLKVEAIERWEESAGETITVELIDRELSVIQKLAEFAVHDEKREAGNIDAHFVRSDEVPISEDDEQMLKGKMFEDSLARINLGEVIVAAISEHQS